MRTEAMTLLVPCFSFNRKIPNNVPKTVPISRIGANWDTCML